MRGGFDFSDAREHGPDASHNLGEDRAIHLVDFSGKPLRTDEAQLRDHCNELCALVTDRDVVGRPPWT